VLDGVKLWKKCNINCQFKVLRDFTLSFVGFMRIDRGIQFCLAFGIITILCHATAFAPIPDYSISFEYTSVLLPENRSWEDKKPHANDDEVTTEEDSPVSFNVLANDRRGGSEDGGSDEGNSNDEINPSTVDLNPDTDPIDRQLSTTSGLFTVNDQGVISFSPTQNFFGRASIRYTVDSFGNEKSNKASFTVLVTGVNDAPVINAQFPQTLTTREEVPITIQLLNLQVSDPDNIYPLGFSMTIADGENDHYSASGLTVTPDRDYVGALSIPISVSDGSASSENFDLRLLVTEENDPPVITGQNPNPLVTAEEQPITIELSHLIVQDPDNSYPTGFSLSIADGNDYDVNNNVVTPAVNYTGTLLIPVTVNDGTNTSAPFNLQVSVTNVNDAPVITGQNPARLSTPEEQPITISFSNLLVTDVDNSYPTNFTLTLTDGDHYSISGSVVTPDPEYSGEIIVPVIVADVDGANSNTFSLLIDVVGGNDIPVITGHVPLTMEEDNTLALSLSHLQVTDPDDTYPDDFTLSIGSGANYTESNGVITPTTNFFGTLTVPVSVNDGTNSSLPFDVTITVNAVNDAPAITGQQNLSTNENQPITLALENLIVTDVDNTYPGTFTMTVQPGTNYTLSNTTVTPDPGFNGTLSVGVLVNDGTTTSNTYNVQITVNAVNDAPVITGQQPLSYAEDTPFTIQLADLTVTDSDNTYPAGFSLTILPRTNYTFVGNTVTPTANFNGALIVKVLVNDGTSDSQTFDVNVTITPVNDAPVITGQTSLSVNEDQTISITLNDLVVTDPDNTYPTGFTLTASAGDNYTLNGLTVIPTADFKGTLVIPVQVNDGVSNSNVFNLQVTVNDVNDVPVITGQTIVSTNEDTPFTILLSHLTVFDPDNAYPTGFTLTILEGTNYTVNGSTITPAQDFNGTLNVNLKISDGLNESAVFVFQIQVGNTNDPPVITGQSALGTNEESPITISLSDLTVTDPDNSYPTGFSLLVSAGDNFTVSNNTITPDVNFYGTLTVPVRVNDGVNNSPTFDLKIAVNPINDAPSFDAISNVTLLENATPSVITISNISQGPNESDQQITFVATSGNTAVIPNPVITYNGSGDTAELKYSLVGNASGTVTITVVAVDNGAATSPNVNSFTSTFQITVSEVNNAPTLAAVSNITVQEDAPQQDIALSGITAGAGESQQLALEVVADKPELLEIFQVVYNSPSETGSLQIKPKANENGVVAVSVKVVDNGSNVAPSVNFVTRTFTITIVSVNDAPVFESNPIVLAVVNEPYQYSIAFTDIESHNLAVTGLVKPTWLTLSGVNGSSQLAGTPPASAAGPNPVTLRVSDPPHNIDQTFSIFVNSRPVVSAFDVQLTEDINYTFSPSAFTANYSDPDNHAMTSVLVTQLPSYGKLFLNDIELTVTDTIRQSSLAQLVYKPQQDYAGADVFYWKAKDTYHFSSSAAAVNIGIAPVNDRPRVVLAKDTLYYEVNGESAFINSLIDIQDPDDDSLTQVEVYFGNQNFQPEYDMLTFATAPSIRGQYDYQLGKLVLTGGALITDYETVLQSIQYNHLNTLDPDLRIKSLYIIASDGKQESQAKELLIDMQYTFIELEIPSGFTPNGDQSNDTWVITRPGGLEQLGRAVVRIFNRRGVKVFETNGFDTAWDGTFDGDLLPADTYYFTIDLNLRSKKTYRGTITLLR
jgi:large repetitive protein